VGVAADQEAQADAGLVESADEISEIAFGVLETLLSTLFSCSHRRRRRRSERAAFAGFMGSKALFAALDIELFEHIAASSGGLTTDALHARLSSSESVSPAMQLQTLLTALTSLGLLARDDDAGTYTNSPGADLFLAKTNLKYDYGDYLRYQIDKQSARPAPNTSCSAAVAEGLLSSVPNHVAPQHDHEGRGVGAEVRGLPAVDVRPERGKDLHGVSALR